MAVFGLLSLQVLVPGQFARVCHSVNMEWSVKENHMAVIALHNCGTYYSQIFELLKPLKNLRMFIYRAIKRYEELWRVVDTAQSGRRKSLTAQATIKTVPGVDSPKSALETEDYVLRAEHINQINVVPHPGRSTHESVPPLKGTHPYSCSEGDPMDKRRASPPVARRERA